MGISLNMICLQSTFCVYMGISLNMICLQSTFCVYMDPLKTHYGPTKKEKQKKRNGISPSPIFLLSIRPHKKKKNLKMKWYQPFTLFFFSFFLICKA